MNLEERVKCRIAPAMNKVFSREKLSFVPLFGLNHSRGSQEACDESLSTREHDCGNFQDPEFSGQGLMSIDFQLTLGIYMETVFYI